MQFDPTAILNEWGTTLGLLSVAAFTLFTLFLIGLRGFLFWYLQTHKILKGQREILAEIQALKKQLSTVQTTPKSPEDIHVKSTQSPNFPLVQAGESTLSLKLRQEKVN